MTDLIEVQTSTLAGAALDWAVAQVEGVTYLPYYIGVSAFHDKKNWSTKYFSNFQPSTKWSDCGPLIEARMKACGAFCDGLWQHQGIYKCSYERGGSVSEGETPLIAACRAIVATKLGDTVQVPKELI